MSETYANLNRRLGFHILALSPANSNCNQLASTLDSMVPFHRLYPSSRDHDLEKMTPEAFHEDKALPQSELLFALDELERGRGLFQKYGVVEAVISAAAEGCLSLDKSLRHNGAAWGDKVNAWDILREFIRKYKDGTLQDGSKGKYNRTQWKLAYLACKGMHFVLRIGYVRLANLSQAMSSDFSASL